MHDSLAQFEANRKNAALSTGPKTLEGKAASRMNAVSHGLLSSQTLLIAEDANKANAFRESLWRDLSPIGELEAFLADRVISSAWRLRAIVKAETELLGDRLSGLSVHFTRYNANPFLLLPRYEAAIERGLYRALHELQRLQAGRRGVNVPLPLMVDVDVNLQQ